MRTLVSCLLLCSIASVGCNDSMNQKKIQKNESPRTLSPQPAKENRLAGQYIITLKEGASSEALKQVFDQYDIKAIQILSRNRYLIILEQDPGPEVMTEKAATSAEIDAVQPNNVYRAMPATKAKP